MKTVNKIMVAIDFSEYSLPVLKYAAALAADVDAELLLVNVINQRDVDMVKKVADIAPQLSVKTYLEESVTDREAQFQGLIKEAGCQTMAVKTSVRIGVPYKALLQAIEEKKPDILVMAAKGRSNLVDTVIGSCAQKMFRRCPIPLLSIRTGDAD